MSLNLQPNLKSPDDAYAMLLEAHEGLSKAQSDALNARLIPGADEPCGGRGGDWSGD